MASTLNHVTLTFPPGGQAVVRRFYGDLLGLRELPVPKAQGSTEWVWWDVGGDVELHLVPDEALPDATRMHHVCLRVDDLEDIGHRLATEGYALDEPFALPGRRRRFCRDPFGNLVELVQFDG